MKQLSIFFTEESRWIVMGLCAVTVLFLIITLHRIRRITKKMQEIAGNTERLAAQLADIQASVGTWTSGDKTGVQVSPAEMTKEGSGELLDAVLGEVFP